MDAANTVGILASVALLSTLVAQVRAQWIGRTTTGMPRWYFIGECVASAGFLAFSIMIHSSVFIATNAMTLAASICGQLVLRRNRRLALAPRLPQRRSGVLRGALVQAGTGPHQRGSRAPTPRGPAG